MSAKFKAEYYKNLQQIIECDGEIRIAKCKQLNSLVQVYIDKALIAESEKGIDDIGIALSDVNNKVGKYIDDNW